MSRTAKQKSHIGRPQKYKTEKERLAAKRRQNQEAQKRANAKRLEAYHNDPTYREQVLAEQRRRYREAKGIKPASIGQHVGSAKEFARFAQIKAGCTYTRRQVLNGTDMASYLDITPKAFAGWLRTGKLPYPKIKTKDGDRVYLVKQADAIALALKENLQGKTTFRATDGAAIKAVHQAFLRHAKI